MGSPIDVTIGRNGLGPPGEKKEGDGRSPAGVFAIGTSFGFAESAGWKLPYLQLHDTTECVDDPDSTFDNQIVERTSSADWKSSETMRAIKQYKWGAVISHDTPAVKGAGSCVFLHIGAKGRSTAGCTAMAEEDLLTLLRWIDPKKSPRIVQLPRAEYDSMKREWGLP